MLGYPGAKISKINDGGDIRSNTLNNLGYDTLISEEFHSDSLI